MKKTICLLLFITLITASINPNVDIRVLQLGPVQEPASTLFCCCLVILLLSIYKGCTILRKNNEKTVLEKYPFHIQRNVFFWCFTFAFTSSVLFHIKENIFTKYSDYLWGYFSTVSFAYFAVVRTLKITNKITQIVTGIPFIGAAVCITVYLTLVKFSYSLHMKCCMIAIIVGSVFFLTWSLISQTTKQAPHCKWTLLGIFFIVVGFPLEAFEFRSILKVLDGHALWHLMNIPICYCFARFVREDMIYHYKAKAC